MGGGPMTAAYTINYGSPELGRGPPDSSPLSGRRRLFCKARRAGQEPPFIGPIVNWALHAPPTVACIMARDSDCLV